MNAPPQAGALPAPPSRPATWLLAARPRTLGASLVPVIVGSAVAHAEGAFQLPVATVCACTALLLQIGTNLANDALDFVAGVDTAARAGPLRVTQAGWLAPADVLRGASVCFALAAVGGAYLVHVGGLPILAIGVASIVGALAYSGGPFSLAAHGLGEAAAFVFFGVLAVSGSAYVQTGSVSLLALLASIPVAALVTGLMAVNNLRDIDTDRAAQKRTLGVRIGPKAMRRLYAALLGAAFGCLPLLLLDPFVGAAGLLPWLSLPLALRVLRGLLRARAAGEFNRALAGTARLHLVYGLLLAVGIAA